MQPLADVDLRDSSGSSKGAYLFHLNAENSDVLLFESVAVAVINGSAAIEEKLKVKVATPLSSVVTTTDPRKV